jgi:Fic family protein
MESQNYLKQINALEQILNRLPPASKEQEDKLWKKFRLEWNYNSNHIEGNTLTYGQTELLLIFGKTSADKDIREYDEMKGHDVAIRMVVEEAKDKERPLTENFIRQLNKTILVSPFWKEAITQDGQNTRREIQIGQYKSMPNSVRLLNGEIFHYASPQETPALMQDLVDWYNSQKDVHPVTLAAMFHYRFVRIHPFDDGNGRGARLLMNYILLKNNLPPVIIKSYDKANYLLALNKADAGDLQAFVDYIAAQMIWSLDLSIKAAKGQNIEEVNDWKKGLELLKRSLPEESDVKYRKNDEVIKNLALEVLDPLFKKVLAELKRFDEFFSTHIRDIQLSNYPDHKNNATITDIIDGLGQGTFYIRQNLVWRGFKKKGINTFNISSLVECHFDEFTYIITYPYDKTKKVTKLYHQHLSDEEQNQIVSDMANEILLNIDVNLKTA